MGSARERTIKNQVVRVMRNVKIPDVSYGVLNSDGTSSTMTLGVTKNGRDVKERPESIFGVASLSKPIFAYLVLKLIEENQSNPDKIGVGKFIYPAGVTQFNLDTPLYQILPELAQCKDPAKAKALTARMVLSHQTGILHSQAENTLPEFYTEPGTEYEYNGLTYFYLQIALDRLTHSTLQELAKKHVFDPLVMSHSTFLKPISREVDYGDEKELVKQFPANPSQFPAISANSVRTTVSDYMRFISHWINEPKLAYAFESRVSMTTDRWAKAMGLNNDFLERIASGLGWALQKNSQGQVTHAFQWGDMGHWRADIAIDLLNKKAIVFFAHSTDGHILAHHIISPYVDLNDGLKFISEKLGFAVKFEEGWKEKEKERFAKVDRYLKSRTNKEEVNPLSLESKSASEETKEQNSSSLSIFISPTSKS